MSKRITYEDIKRQMEHASEDIKTWPTWMRRAAGLDGEGPDYAHMQAENAHLREQNRVLRLEFQSLLNAIDDSYDEDLPVEIVEARNKAQAALTATSQEGQG